MKDINYFLEKEQKFQKDHPKEELYFDKQLHCLMPQKYPDDFLRDGWFGKYSKDEHSSEVKKAIQEYNLTKVECLILICFLGNLSKVFRDDYYNEFGEIPEVTKEMQDILECIIKKAPTHDGGVVYRFLQSEDNSLLKKGETITIAHSLTTTNKDWGQDESRNKNVYVITPLPKEKTFAHDLYKILNHGDENQVNFLRASKFLVKDVVINKENKTKRIYLDEIE